MAGHRRDRSGWSDTVAGVEAVVEAYGDLAEWILDQPPLFGRSRLIAVDGPSGSGKTVFAKRLAGALTRALGGRRPDPAVAPADGPTTPVVHTDDLLDGWRDQLTFWPRLEEWVLDPLRAGEAGAYRRYCWPRGHFGAHWTTVQPAPVVILEGVSTARAVIRPELTLAVFVTADPRLRLDRALGRDGGALLPYLEQWRRGEEAHFSADRTAEHADLLVDGAPQLPHDPDVGYVRLP
jgi:energy-coupling factor transporter ATP-binding protein EcfA2